MPLTVLAAAVWCLAPGPVEGQTSVDFATGDAFNLRTPLTIRQDGQPDIYLKDADYDTRPFKAFPYWDIQVGLWNGSKGWIIGMLHHKLILDNPPVDVEKFEITNGFTVFSLSRGWRKGHLMLSAGAGVVLANPNVRIRGLNEPTDKGLLRPILGSGYYLSGGTILLGVQRNFRIKGGWHVSLASKLSGSYARVPMPDGYALVRNVALHLHAGFGLTL